MQSLYVTSIENFSGKTAVCLGIGRRFQAEGTTIGYVKPVSYVTTQFAGNTLDEDVTFVKNVLSLETDPQELASIVVTPDTLNECLTEDGCDFTAAVKSAAERAGEGKDLLLIEGSASLREGYVLGLSAGFVTDMLDTQSLVVVKYRGRQRLLDDSLTAQFRLGDRLMGVILNRVPESEMDFVTEQATPYLERKGIPVLGAMPERPNLAAISVGEIIDVLEAKVLSGEDQRDTLIEELVIGAMGAREALSRFRRYPNKAVITGGDRTDLQLAALETSTACLVLTGNLTPSPSVMEQAADQNVPVLLVRESTMGAIEQIEEVFGKTRLGQAEKLAHFESLMAEHVDYKRIREALSV